MTTIAIQLHARDDSFAATPYLLKPMIGLWQARGLEVTPLRGCRNLQPADLLIPHLDLTVTPPDYAAAYDRYPRVLNRNVLDISKSSFSANLLRRDDTYEGPVIVKTVGNYGGIPDRRLAVPGRNPRPSRLTRSLAKLAHRIAGRTHWRHLEHLAPSRYPTFESLAEVPADVFDNPNLIVERFLAERDGEAFCIRYYYFLGDREIGLRFWSHHRIAKGSNIYRAEECPVPSELHALRQRLGFDFGKFDYVMHGGRTEVFDLNRTPSSSVLGRFGLYDRVARHLAGGIDSLLG